MNNEANEGAEPNGSANGGSNTELTGLSVCPRPELLDAGWEQRNLCDPTRVDELSELYESLGNEVHTEKLTPQDFGAKCDGCAQIACQSYVLIFTRKK